MENTNTRLEQAIQRMREQQETETNKELDARRLQVQVLLGIKNECGVIKCPNCGQHLVDPRPKDSRDDEDYDTRL